MCYDNREISIPYFKTHNNAQNTNSQSKQNRLWFYNLLLSESSEIGSKDMVVYVPGLDFEGFEKNIKNIFEKQEGLFSSRV
jgi:hypothetical protein